MALMDPKHEQEAVPTLLRPHTFATCCHPGSLHQAAPLETQVVLQEAQLPKSPASQNFCTNKYRALWSVWGAQPRKERWVLPGSRTGASPGSAVDMLGTGRPALQSVAHRLPD